MLEANPGNPEFQELPLAVLDPGRWSTSFFGKFTLPEYIGVLEARSVLLALRSKARIVSNWNRQHLNLCNKHGGCFGAGERSYGFSLQFLGHLCFRCAAR
eukprot:4403368-Amphidinium_carterae.3